MARILSDSVMLKDTVHRLLVDFCHKHDIEYFNRAISSKYGRDNSCICMHPQAVVNISHPRQLPPLIAFAKDHNLTVAVRGGGSNTGGAGITYGVLVDVAKLNTISPPQPLNQLNQQDIAPPQQATHVVAVEAGTTIYELNRYLEQYSLLFPVVPTSQRVAQVGGVVATNAGSPMSLRYGTIQRWIASIDFCDGNAIAHSYIDNMLCSPQTSKTKHPSISETADSIKAIVRGAVTVGLRARILRYAHCKQIPGYNLSALLHSLKVPHFVTCNAALAGSMGTLGIISKALLYCMPKPQSEYIMILEFATLSIALKMLTKLRAIVHRFQQIVSCELLPISQPEQRTKLLLGIQYMISQADIHVIRDAIWDSLGTHLVSIGHFSHTSAIGSNFMQQRKTAVQAHSSDSIPLPIINDITVPPVRLANDLPALMAFLKTNKVRFVVYGHILQGNVHFRPYINFSTVSEKYAVLQLARRFYRLVHKLGGIIGGEHGTGVLRAPYVPQLWGKAGYAIMQQLLKYFNPQHTLDASVMFNTVFPEQLPASLYGLPHII